MLSGDSFPVKLSGIAFLLCAFAYLLYWNLYALLLPFASIQNSYSALVLHQNWLLVNSFQIIAVWGGLIGITAYCFTDIKKIGLPGFISTLIILSSFLLLGGIAIGETFFWPIIAGLNPELLNGKAILENQLMRFLSALGFGSFAAGNCLFGISLLYNKRTKAWIAILIGSGGLLYCSGFLLGDFRYLIQSAALIVLLLGGYIPFGISLIIKKIEPKSQRGFK